MCWLTVIVVGAAGYSGHAKRCVMNREHNLAMDLWQGGGGGVHGRGG